jgi:hypothetical protein
VVVSMDAFLFWGPPRVNKPLEDFLARNFHDVAQYGGYRVLMRNDQP